MSGIDNQLIAAQTSSDIDTALTARRFLALVGPRSDLAGACWLWSGHVKPDGYGTFRIGAKTLAAHRVALSLCGVKVEGLEVHHACLNRSCVRPVHLQALTPDEHGHAQKLAKLNASSVSS